jgi:DNA-binding transcriptional MerR regulator
MQDLPEIPDKIYFDIGEASELCNLKPYVLRFWELEFPQLKPEKRTGNRRFYRKKDILLVRQISDLLYKQGFTIEGARAKLTKPLEANQQLLQEIAQELEAIILKHKNGA